MIKEILTNLRDDKSIYIQSSGGLSIIQIAYFKPDNFDDAIINLRYFGSLEKDNFKYSGFRFDADTFYDFYSHLQDMVYSDQSDLSYCRIAPDDERLFVTKSNKGISVYKYVSKHLQDRNDPLWEFNLDIEVAKALVEQLQDMVKLIATHTYINKEVLV